MLYDTAQERYEKLKRLFHRLMARFNRDEFDDFIQVANSLHDWIKKDPTVSREQRHAFAKFIVPESLDWQVCHQLANHQKHAATRQPKNHLSPILKAVHYEPGGSRGVAVPPSMRIIGAGDEITIEYEGGRTTALPLVARTFRQFHYIFEVASIPSHQRIVTTLPQLLGL
jgi:hypothetical protein